MRVLVSDKISDQGVEILKKAGIEVDVNTSLAANPDELKKEIVKYDGLVVRSATKVTADVIAAATNLKVIGRAGSGVDNIDVKAASAKGIVVMNTPGGNTVTTAEHAVALLFAACRQVPQAAAALKAGKWEKSRMGIELYNKTIGIIGLGQIGSHVARVANGLFMNVVAYDPFLSPEKAAQLGVEQVDLPTLYKKADFITIHSPLTPETKGLINADVISQMKKGVVIVCAARGGIIDEKALYDALVSKHVAAAALDVFEKEPAEASNPLLALDNFIGTPHLGASTMEAQENVALAVAEQIADYLVNNVIRNAVNMASVPADVLPRLQPYLTLAEKLGAFQAQLYEGGLTEIEIEYSGEVAEMNVAPVTIAVLKGLLTPISEHVNYVNAPIMAKERGIEVRETKSSDTHDFASLITLKVKTKQGVSAVSGALFQKKDPRIVEIDGFAVEAFPEGHMLVMHNYDKPGVIGNIGTTLGKHGINIARMEFGRRAMGENAISVVNIDSAASAELIEEIKKVPNIISVKQIKL